MEKFRQKNIHTAFTTLHVGAGTFQPVKAASMQEHDMHAEYITIDISFLKTLLTQLPQPIIAVGTTSLRTLETIYWLGVKAALKQLDPAKGLTQWEVYDHLPENFSASEALQALTEWMKQQELTTLITRTRLLIAPGYRLRLANGLVTNFHQPQSTLLLLVASIIGSSWKQVYNEALSRGFRFLSYGDGMFIKPRG